MVEHTPGPRLTNRRGALIAAGSAALALRAGPAAGKQKSCKKKARQKVDQACERMRDECLAYYRERCDESSNPAACLADMTICCDHLADGNFTEHVTCLYAPR